VQIAVTDRGVGIAPEFTERVFERFFRIDPARSRSTGGTGLGLAIVKHVAANHGGSATVWSRPGTGSTFMLRLPGLQSAGQDNETAAPATAPSTAAAGAPSPTQTTSSTAVPVHRGVQ
jgi:two-component system sensor histidine kinase SenX3